MDSWQKQWISKNLSTLTEEIKCNTQLIVELVQSGCLSKEEEEKLSARKTLDGKIAAAYLLLDILTTRINAYQHLCRSLYRSYQTGPMVTLLNGVEMNLKNTNPFKYCGITLDLTQYFEKDVLFGGKVMSLRLLTQYLDSAAVLRHVSENMNTTLYKTFDINAKPTICKDTVPAQVSYYVPRTLLVQTKLKEEIFSSLSTDVFLFEGIGLNLLTSLAKKHIKGTQAPGHQLVDTSEKQVRKITVRFILLTSYSDIDRISSLGETIHRIKFTEGDYLYIETIPREQSVKVLDYLIHEEILEIDFVPKFADSQALILYDSPGMGKSTFLAELSRSFKNFDPKNIVIYLQSCDFVSLLHCCTQDEVKPQDIIYDALIELLSVNKLGKAITKEALTCSRLHTYLHVDGFDELDKKNQEVCLKILKILLHWTNIRIAVATRPHGRIDLTKTLGAVAFRILPFQERDQQCFFVQYWKENYNIAETPTVKLYALQCLKSFNQAISTDERNIVGIPLQCRMLADLYAEEVIRNIGTGVLLMKCRISSVFNMYSSYIEMKLAGNCKNTQNVNKIYHATEALNLFFNQNLVQPNIRGFSDNRLYQIGLMECGVNGKPSFVHKTFAEFLAAEEICLALFGESKLLKVPTVTALMKKILITEPTHSDYYWIEPLTSNWLQALEDWKRGACRFKYEGHLYDFVNSNTIFFLNKFLEKLGCNHSLKLQWRESDLIFANQTCFYEILCGSLHGNYDYIFDLVLSLYAGTTTINYEMAKNHISSTFFEKFPFIYILNCAAYYSSLGLVKRVHDLSRHFAGRNFHEYTYIEFDPLTLAVKRGDFQVVQYLIDISTLGYENKKNPLFYCLLDSMTDSVQTINNKKEIIELFCANLPHSMEDDVPTKPILAKNPHFSLVKLLISKDVKLDSVDSENRCIAHTVASSFSPQEFHEFVLLLISKHRTHLFKLKNAEGDTPIHVAFQSIKLIPATINLLANECGVNYLQRDMGFQTELDTAILCKQPLEVIFSILEISDCRTLTTTCGLFSYTPLIAAAKSNNYELVKNLVDMGFDVNELRGGDTCLGIALKERNKQMVKFLIKHGASVNRAFADIDYFESQDEISLEFVGKVIMGPFTTPLSYARRHQLEEYLEIFETAYADNLKSCMTSCCCSTLWILRWFGLCGACCSMACVWLDAGRLAFHLDANKRLHRVLCCCVVCS